MLRLPEGSAPRLHHRAQIGGRCSARKRLAELMQGELLEELEGVAFAERLAFIQRAEGGGDLQILLHLVRPLAERNAVRLAVLPALENTLACGCRGTWPDHRWTH